MDEQKAVIHLMESHDPWPNSTPESILELRTHQLQERPGADE